MSREPLFAGLIVDEFDHPVGSALVGADPCYVVDDHGFKLHLASEAIDRQVLALMQDFLQGHEDLVGEQAAKMLGQDDIFTVATIIQQLKHLDQQFDLLLKMGIPEAQRAYLGMLGFRVRINMHGEVLGIDQPGVADGGEGE
jgi:hypothetical protein